MIIAERLTSKAIAYEPSFDRRSGVNPLEINRNLETFLGERLNVLLSKNKYAIKNNLIYGEYRDEPFVNSIRRGVEYRRTLDGEQRVDSKREKAEIDGFSMIQDILCNPNVPTGTMMISVSPPGREDSLYKHNFYDIFTLKKEKGERFIEARRYSSALASEEYREKLELFYPKVYGKDVVPADDYFLSHPVVINNGFLSSPDGVHAYIHKNHEYMEEKDFEQVTRVCSPFIKSYIRALSENPKDVDTHNLILDAILNKADKEADNIRHKRFWTQLHQGFAGQASQNDIFVRTYDSLSLDREIEFLGNQPVRQVATGCGTSSGFSNNSSGKNNGSVFSSPFSVSEFGKEQEYFTCPRCKYKADGPIGNECPGCGLTKEAYAEESGEMVCD